MLLNAAKCQGYSFSFLVIRGKPTDAGEGGGVKLTPPSTQIRVNRSLNTTMPSTKKDGFH